MSVDTVFIMDCSKLRTS